MNDNKMELEELDLEQIMKEFGDSDESIDEGQEEVLVQLDLDVDDLIGDTKEETQPEEAAEAPAEEPAPEESETPCVAEEPEADEELGDTKDLLDSLASLREAVDEEKREESFRSVLELLLLIDSALDTHSIEPEA